MIFKKNRRGNILTENIIFIVLNLAFLTILILFVVSKMSSVAVLEERYSKQIALMIDAAKPGMEIHFNMEDAVNKKEEGVGNIVTINDNVVTVKLRAEGVGYSYSFFNNVDANIFPDQDNINYVLTINEKT